MGSSRPPIPAENDTVASLRAELEEARVALEQSMVERRRLEQVAAEAAERERRVLAQTLHDTVSQSLTGIYLQTQVIVKKLQKNSADGVREVTNLAETIHGTVLELSEVTRGLQSAEGGSSDSAFGAER